MSIKNKCILIFCILLRLIITLFSVHISCASAKEYYPKAIVDVHEDSYLIVRKGPGIEYDTTHLHLASRAVISILEVQDGWALIHSPTLIGKRKPFGWVCMDYLSYNEIGLEIWQNLGK